MPRRNLQNAAGIIAISLLCWHVVSSATTHQGYDIFRIFVATNGQVEREYVQPIESNEIFQGGIAGLIASLDSESSYLTPSTYQQLQEEAEKGEIGIYVESIGQQRGIRVLGVLPGSSAEQAGILPGDVIAEINDQNSTRLSLEESLLLIRGEPDSDLSLKIYRPSGFLEFPLRPSAISDPENGAPTVANDGSITISIQRSTLVPPDITGLDKQENGTWNHWITEQHNIAYVRLVSLNSGTSQSLSQLMTKFSQDSCRGVILDLRFNVSGSRAEAIKVADLFISEGELARVRGPNLQEEHWTALSDDTFEQVPLAVLTNQFTAGPSEMLAASLKDNDRAPIIGERTRGKTSVTRIIPLKDGKSALKLTVGSCIRPNGKDLLRYPGDRASDSWGVKPDFEIGQMAEVIMEHFRTRTISEPPTFQDEALSKALELLTSETEPENTDS